MSLEEFFEEWDRIPDVEEPPSEAIREIPRGVESKMLLDEKCEVTEEVAEGLANMKTYAGPSKKEAKKEARRKEVAKKNQESRQALFDRLGGNLRYHPKGAVYR